MNESQLLVIRMLNQLIREIRKISNDDFDKLIHGEARVDISIQIADTRKPSRGLVRETIDIDKFTELYDTLKLKDDRTDAEFFLEKVFNRKDDLFAFAQFLELPVQRNDKIERIRERIVAHTVGRRLSGEAVRGKYGKE